MKHPQTQMQSNFFFHKITVSSADLDEMNHVNNIVYLKFMQEAAILHWYALASKETIDSMRWVARRHEIDYLKQAFLDDELTIKTWVSEFSAVTSHRHYEVLKGNDLIAKAITHWVALDSQTLRPKRLTSDITSLFFES